MINTNNSYHGFYVHGVKKVYAERIGLLKILINPDKIHTEEELINLDLSGCNLDISGGLIIIKLHRAMPVMKLTCKIKNNRVKILKKEELGDSKEDVKLKAKVLQSCVREIRPCVTGHQLIDIKLEDTSDDKKTAMFDKVKLNSLADIIKVINITSGEGLYEFDSENNIKIRMNIKDGESPQYEEQLQNLIRIIGELKEREISVHISHIVLGRVNSLGVYSFSSEVITTPAGGELLLKMKLEEVLYMHQDTHVELKEYLDNELDSYLLGVLLYITMIKYNRIKERGGNTYGLFK